MRNIPINNAHIEMRYDADRAAIEISIIPEGYRVAPVFFIEVDQGFKLQDAFAELCKEHLDSVAEGRSKSPWAR